jgi:two-component system CheB/CheR fusion protein
VVSVRELVEAAVDVVRPLMDKSAQVLSVALPAPDVWLDVDAVRISQVIGNLLHNASKFTPRGGRIGLEARRAQESLHIIVTDTGVGIPPELLGTVFDLFAQADGSLDRAQGGLGIGLSLVRGLVAMHGGEVSAESDGPGKGSRFTVRLPVGAVEAKRPRPRARVAPVAALPRRVLIVEDNADAAEAMRLLLGAMGHEVTTVGDGAEAIAMARSFRPDVILLDIGLPGIDGYELARRFRLLDETSAARVVAVTGYGQPADRERSAAAGFHHHLVKPVDPAKLVEALNFSS